MIVIKRRARGKKLPDVTEETRGDSREIARGTGGHIRTVGRGPVFPRGWALRGHVQKEQGGGCTRGRDRVHRGH